MPETKTEIFNEKLKQKRHENNLTLLKSATAMLALLTCAFYIQNELAPGLPREHLFNRIYTALFLLMFFVSLSFFFFFRYADSVLKNYQMRAGGIFFTIFFSVWIAALAGMDYKAGDQASFYGLALLTIAVIIRANIFFYIIVYSISVSAFTFFFLHLPGKIDFLYFFHVGIYVIVSLFFAHIINFYFSNSLSLHLDLEKKNEELKLLSIAVEQSPASIVITDPDGNIEYTNLVMEMITGYSSRELIGKKPSILKSGKTPEDVYKLLWDTVLSGKIWQGEFINARKNGEIFIENAIIAPVKDDAGVIINLLAVKEDITARKGAEERLRASEEMLREANDAKDKFFSIIAHDLRNPFTALIGISDLLKINSKVMDDSERDEYLGLMHTSIIKASSLLEDLLVWARSQSGKIPFSPYNFDLNDLIVETIPLIALNAKHKGIRVDTELSASPCVVYADYNMMKTILLNLLTNSVKFTRPSGNITAGCRSADAGSAALFVRDTGIGIPEILMPNLFRIDESVSRNGTQDEPGNGLGLLLCYEFVKKNRGDISVESQIGEGTVFTVTIPANENHEKITRQEK